MVMVMASKYVTSNLTDGEKIVKIFLDGWLLDKTCIVLTNKRLFGWNEKFKNYSWNKSSIKSITVDLNLLSRTKGKVIVTGAYGREVTFASKDVEADRDLIIKTLKLDL